MDQKGFRYNSYFATYDGSRVATGIRIYVNGRPWAAYMSIKAQPSIPNEVVMTMRRSTKRSRLQATRTSGALSSRTVCLCDVGRIGAP